MHGDSDACERRYLSTYVVGLLLSGNALNCRSFFWVLMHAWWSPWDPELSRYTWLAAVLTRADRPMSLDGLSASLAWCLHGIWACIVDIVSHAYCFIFWKCLAKFAILWSNCHFLNFANYANFARKIDHFFDPPHASPQVNTNMGPKVGTNTSIRLLSMLNYFVPQYGTIWA